MHWYLSVLKRWAEFDGRARRKEYWIFMFNMIIVFLLTIVDRLIGTAPRGRQGLIASIYLVGVLMPAVAVGVRRLHDTGRSGWWHLIGFVPILGAIVLLPFMVKDGDPGENQYGPDPKTRVAVG